MGFLEWKRVSEGRRASFQELPDCTGDGVKLLEQHHTWSTSTI